jgi:hypothetical protein
MCIDKDHPKIKSIYIDLYGTIDVKDFIEAIFSGLTQIETKLDKLLVSGLKLSGSVDPMTGQPSVSVSLEPSDKPNYLDTAMDALAAYSAKQKLLVVFDQFQYYARKEIVTMLYCHWNKNERAAF